MNGGRAQRADVWFGLFWTLLGAVIAVESWRMDRLEQQHINPYTVPGLVPGLLGVVLAVFGIVLLLRGWRGQAPRDNPLEEELLGLDETPVEDAEGSAEPWRIAAALVLCLGFGAGLVGSGLPFWLAAFAFVFLAILVFEWPERRAAGTLAQGVMRAVAVAGVASVAISLVFEKLFLVRLP